MSDRNLNPTEEVTTNNNTGHIVVENSENNNVGDGAASYYNEEAIHRQTEDQGTGEELWLSEGEDEDENYEDDDDSGDVIALTQAEALRVPVNSESLPETVTVLERNGCTVYLVGTAHFSKESQNDVSKVIQAVKPHVVMVELCQSRVNILQMDEARILEEAGNLSLATLQQVIKRNGVMQGALNILLLNMSAYITKELGMAPGGEFRVAFNEARNLKAGCKFILGDRPIQITMRRALASLSLWQQLKLAYAILFSKEPITKEDVEKCKRGDMLEQMIEEMTGEFPALGQVFVRERDIYLAHSLRKVAQPISCLDAPGGEVPAVVVGVVGIGHVQGISENWNRDDLDVEEICRIPRPSTFSVIAKWGVRCSILGLFSYGCYKASRHIILPLVSSVVR